MPVCPSACHERVVREVHVVGLVVTGEAQPALVPGRFGIANAIGPMLNLFGVALAGGSRVGGGLHNGCRWFATGLGIKRWSAGIGFHTDSRSGSVVP